MRDECTHVQISNIPLAVLCLLLEVLVLLQYYLSKLVGYDVCSIFAKLFPATSIVTFKKIYRYSGKHRKHQVEKMRFVINYTQHNYNKHNIYINGDSKQIEENVQTNLTIIVQNKINHNVQAMY